MKGLGHTEGGSRGTDAAKAVILAAGAGTRLRRTGRLSPKPLVRVLGVSLLKRQLRCLAGLPGLEEVIVVIGCHAGALRRRIERTGPWPFALRVVENPDWALGNGMSLYAAKECVGEGSFYVLMVDHIFEPEAVERFAEDAGGDLALAVSSGRSETLNLDDATKVRTDDLGIIRAIGKDLADFNAIEMGLFRLDRRIFFALERAFRAGEHSLTAGVRRLIEETSLRAVASPHAWFDIDTGQDLRHAERYLLRRIPSQRDGLIAKHLNRRLSLPLSRILANWGVTPTQITFSAFTLSLLSGALFALGLPLAGGLLAQAGSVVDGMDGEIARMRGMETKFGAFIDSLLDRLGDGVVLLGLGLLALSSAPGPGTLALTALALLVSPLSMEVKDRYFTVYGRTYIPDDHDRWTRYLFANHDGRMLLVCLGGIFAVPRLTLALLIGTGFAQAAYRVWRIRRIERERNVAAQEGSPRGKDLEVR